MKLTEEEIKETAYRLDVVIGDHFHDTMCSVIWERNGDWEVEVSDEDISAIKEQLKRIL